MQSARIPSKAQPTKSINQEIKNYCHCHGGKGSHKTFLALTGINDKICKRARKSACMCRQGGGIHKGVDLQASMTICVEEEQEKVCVCAVEGGGCVQAVHHRPGRQDTRDSKTQRLRHVEEGTRASSPPQTWLHRRQGTARRCDRIVKRDHVRGYSLKGLTQEAYLRSMICAVCYQLHHVFILQAGESKLCDPALLSRLDADRVCLHVHIHVCTCLHVLVFVCMFVCVRACAQTHELVTKRNEPLNRPRQKQEAEVQKEA